jgi:hypothetical protein
MDNVQNCDSYFNALLVNVRVRHVRVSCERCSRETGSDTNCLDIHRDV